MSFNESSESFGKHQYMIGAQFIELVIGLETQS